MYLYHINAKYLSFSVIVVIYSLGPLCWRERESRLVLFADGDNFPETLRQKNRRTQDLSGEQSLAQCGGRLTEGATSTGGNLSGIRDRRANYLSC